MRKVECPHCGADLVECGVGYDSHCYQVHKMDSYDSPSYGDVIEFYCPECGEEITTELALEAEEEMAQASLREKNYLEEKEQVCGLDKEERYELNKLGE